MKIIMLAGLSGPTVSLAPGDEHECDDAEAIRLIEAGFARPVRDAGNAETAVLPNDAETATAGASRKTRK